MTFLQALYGSQHKEISDRGREGSKGRLNGNLFLSAYVMIAFFILLMLLARINPAFSDGLTDLMQEVFGYRSGKTLGKLLAIPLLAVIYFIISKTVGSEANFDKHVVGFYNEPIDEQNKANMKILIPFFVLLAGMFALAVL